jgi:glucose/arabinose dehydrogenase
VKSRLFPAGILAVCACCAAAGRAVAAMPHDMVVEPVVTGLAYPVNMAFASDGRIFFDELESGSVRIVKDGQLLPTPFASFSIFSDHECGLIGIALPPGFPNEQPWVYVYFTARVHSPGDPAEGHPENHIARVHADGDVGGTVETLLVTTMPQFHIHNGGELVFGPDGKLYVTVGDAFDMLHAQDLGFLNGKILRLELDGTGAAGNPFGSSDATRARIYTRGHRNHIGLAFQPLTGELYQTENGPNAGDEINHIVAGANYGWPTCTGPCDQPQPGLTDPILSYTPTIAPTGLSFLRPVRYRPGFGGDLLFGAYNDGMLHRVHFDPNTPDKILSVDDRFFDVQSLLAPAEDPNDHHLVPLDVTTGPDGNLWFTAADFPPGGIAASASAGIYRLRDTTVQPPATPAAVPALLILGASTAVVLGRRRAYQGR